MALLTGGAVVPGSPQTRFHLWHAALRWRGSLRRARARARARAPLDLTHTQFVVPGAIYSRASPSQPEVGAVTTCQVVRTLEENGCCSASPTLCTRVGPQGSAAQEDLAAVIHTFVLVLAAPPVHHTTSQRGEGAGSRCANPRRMITAALVVLALTAPLTANTSTSVNDSVNGSELIADEVEDDAHDDAWRAGTRGAAIGGGVGAVAGLAVIGGYLLVTASGQRIEMPFGGYELFLAVPAATSLAAAIGSVGETAIHGDASWTNAGIAGLGGAVAGVVGGVAAVGVGIGTAYVTGAALQAARTNASTLENAGIGIVLGGAVGTATYLAAAAAIPAVAVEMFGE